MKWLDRLFAFERHGTSASREIVAGLTTFTTMSYIVAVNPAILASAGIPEGPSFVATVIVAVAGCWLMAFYANRPFAIAPYMGENAFIAFTVCKGLGIPWQIALAAIFIAGMLFVLMTVLRLRQWIVEAVPTALRYSFAVGIGLFLTFIGLNETGLVTIGIPGAPVRAGHLTSPAALVSMFGFVLIAILIIRKIPGAILVGIIVTAVVAFFAGVAPAPAHVISTPPSISPILWQLDLRGALSWKAFPVVLTIFIMAFVDTMGTLIGLSARAGFLDEQGQLPQIERPMLADAISTCLAPGAGYDHSGRVCGVGDRNRVRRTNRFHGAGYRNMLPTHPVLCAVHLSHSAASLWPGVDRGRAIHARTDRAYRLRRLHGVHTSFRGCRAHGIYVQYRNWHHRGIRAVPAVQARSRRAERG